MVQLSQVKQRNQRTLGVNELPVDSPRPKGHHRQPSHWLRSGDFVRKAIVTPQLHAAQ